MTGLRSTSEIAVGTFFIFFFRSNSLWKITTRVWRVLTDFVAIFTVRQPPQRVYYCPLATRSRREQRNFNVISFFFSKIFQEVCYWKKSTVRLQQVGCARRETEHCVPAMYVVGGQDDRVEKTAAETGPLLRNMNCTAWLAAMAARLKGGRTRKTVCNARSLSRRLLRHVSNNWRPPRARGIWHLRASAPPPFWIFQKFFRKYSVLDSEFLFKIPAHFVCRQNQIFPGRGWNKRFFFFFWDIYYSIPDRCWNPFWNSCLFRLAAKSNFPRAGLE